MTSRENFINFFKGEKYEWIPSLGESRTFNTELIPEYPTRGFVMQQHPFPKEQYGGKGWFDVDWIFVPQVMGSIERSNPIQDISEWRNLPWPDLDSYDWEGMAKDNEEYLTGDFIISCNVFSTYYERLISLIGFENAAMAMIDEDCENDIHELFDKLTDLYIDFAQRYHKYCNVTRFVPHDDWGTQQSLIFSKARHDKLILPYVTRFVKALHDMDCIYEQHSCGNVRPLIPNMIDAGTDTWVGQDIYPKDKLVEEFGDQFIFAVWVRPKTKLSDEDYWTYFMDIYNKYKAIGKKVWFYTFPATATPQQRKRVVDFLKQEGPWI